MTTNTGFHDKRKFHLVCQWLLLEKWFQVEFCAPFVEVNVIKLQIKRVYLCRHLFFLSYCHALLLTPRFATWGRHAILCFCLCFANNSLLPICLFIWVYIALVFSCLFVCCMLSLMSPLNFGPSPVYYVDFIKDLTLHRNLRLVT